MIVFLPLAALMILIPETTLLNLSIWGSHIVIDSIKKLSYPWVEEGHFQKEAFTIDQLAHYTCIIVFTMRFLHIYRLIIGFCLSSTLLS